MGSQKQRDPSRGILPALTLALALLSITLAGAGSVLAQSPFQTSFKVGDPAPDFDVRDLDGNALKLSDLRGKVVVLNFWFIACPPCRAEMPALNQLVQHFQGQEVVFIGLAADPAEELREFLKTHEFLYQVVPDATPIAELYVVRGAPTHIIIDQEGRFAKIVYGAIGDVQTALEEPISRLIVRQASSLSP
jgi:peroxiredoxin